MKIILVLFIVISSVLSQENITFLDTKNISFENSTVLMQSNSLTVTGSSLTKINSNTYWLKNCELLVNQSVHVNLRKIMTINNSVPMDQSVSGHGYIVESTEKNGIITSLVISQSDDLGKTASDPVEIKFNGNTYTVNY